MTKKTEQGNGGKSKMTVVMFHTEGSDATLQEGFRAINVAMTSLLKPPQSVVRQKSLVAPPLASEAVDVSEMSHDGEEEQVSAELEAEPVRVSKQRSYPSPEIIRDLDLVSGDNPLKAFLQKKGVGDSEVKRCLAIAVWLKDERAIAEIGADHLFTCYRHMGWQAQKDVTVTLRGLKKQDCFSKGKTAGTYAVNHIGENRVMEMATS